MVGDASSARTGKRGAYTVGTGFSGGVCSRHGPVVRPSGQPMVLGHVFRSTDHGAWLAGRNESVDSGVVDSPHRFGWLWNYHCIERSAFEGIPSCCGRRVDRPNTVWVQPIGGFRIPAADARE
jgi:hypothetical protein